MITLTSLQPALDRMLARLALGVSRLEGEGEEQELIIGSVSITKGERVPVNTLGRVMTIAGWDVTYWKYLPGDRDTPPAVDAVPVYHGANPWEALTQAVCEVVHQICNDVLVCMCEESAE